MLNLNYKKWVRGKFSRISTIVRNVLGNEFTVIYSNANFLGDFGVFSYYSQYYDGSSASNRGPYPSLIVGSGTPTDYALGNAILNTVLHADSSSTGELSGTKLKIRTVLRNITTTPVTVSEVGLYAAGAASSSSVIARPGGAATFMIGSQTIDPVTVAPGEYITILLELDFPEVTE